MDEEEISYKTLRKIQQAERNSPQITKINKDFYQKVNSFLYNLEKRLEQEKKPQKQMLLAEESQNIEKIIFNIYEQREKKIMLAAIAKARGGSPTIKTLLPEEKTFFDELYQTITSFRKQMFSTEEEYIKQHITEPEQTSSKLDEKEKVIDKQNQKNKEEKKKTNNTHPILRILEEVGSFVGTDNNTYTLHKADIISLPDDMAKMLLNKRVAIQINEL